MKKQFFAAAIILALGAGFTACSSDDLGKQEAKAVSQTGTSYMTVSFRLPAPSATRASNSDALAGTPATGSGRYQYGSWNGKDKIESVKVFVFKDDNTLEKVQTYSENELAFTQNTSGDVKVTANNAFKITAGDKKVYIVVNPTDVENLPATEGTTFDAFKEKYEGKDFNFTAEAYPTAADAVTKTRADEVAKVSDGKDVIMMTGAPQSITIEDGVTAQQAVAGAKNQVALTVKRVAARVLVTTATGKTEFTINGDDPQTTTVKEDNYAIAKVTDLTYTVAQGEKTFYVQGKDYATKGTTQDLEGEKTYEETPGFNYVPAKSDQFWAKQTMESYQDAVKYYDYSGLWKTASSVTARTAFINGAGQDQDEVDLVTGHITATTGGDAGIFVLPTTHAYGADADATSYRGANTAYVLVRGKITPQFYVNADGQLTMSPLAKGTTFYLGANGLAYVDAKCVQDPKKGGVAGQTAQKFVDGKVLYYVWIHPDNIAKPENSPVDRNHIYHIQIASISKYGANWNPFVPYPKNTPELDPNTGKPKNDPTGKTPNNPNNPDDRPNDNPFEPVNPPVNPFENLTPKETWMSVNVTILPWQVHSYQVNL